MGSGVRLGDQGGCERRSEVIVNFKKKNKFGGGGVRSQGGGIGREDPVGEVRVDVNEELK